MESTTAPHPKTGRSGCRSAVLWLLGLGLVGALGGWFLFAHDFATKRVANKASKLTREQWRQIYEESRGIRARHAEELKTKVRLVMPAAEAPPMIKALGYEEFYINQEGVSYERAGGGVDIFFTAIHCVYDPQSRAYDRKGVWFLGPNIRDWVYEEGK